ncbi:RHS repeat-associated core domain-containing protein [Alkalimarinus coralli]|uniref:RHS repeat-associated core domain-containing protein n=1 Tax=Alkalimarinus coralli TaxID=2935863 RepID=UPI00202B3136|nr:RHS repeat-associated core domain-containing protein [Alkalimarinus coralli]
MVWKEEYRPFGERIIKDNKADSQKRWFTGHVQDKDTGLVYMGARFYDPTIGRFLTPDPVGFSSNAPMMFNRYAYANNNPYKYVDPDGRNAVTAFGGLLVESFNWASGNGFNGSQVWGALQDGYDGNGSGAWRAAGEDALSFGGGVIGAAAKIYRLAKAGKVTKAAAHGFKNAGEFAKFGKTLNSGLADAGFGGTKALLQGSAVTGKSFRTGKAFDAGRVSDFDIALAGPEILARAKQLGIGLRSGGTRTGPLSAAQVQQLGLGGMQSTLSKSAGRPVNFMIYGDAGAAAARSPSIGF